MRRRFVHCVVVVFAFGCASWTHARRFKSDSSPDKETRHYQADLLAMSALRRFNQECVENGIPAEKRFEHFARNWTDVFTKYRTTAQQITGPLHEGNGVQKLYRQMWAVFGFAVVPTKYIRKALQPFEDQEHWKWIDPYAGNGYLAMQVHKVMGFDVAAWDQKNYDHKWHPMSHHDSTRQPLTDFHAMLLSYPCSQDHSCWSALRRFTDSPRSRVLVYMGEPVEHCCGDRAMWEHICAQWVLRSAHALVDGVLPGSYNFLMVFTKKGLVCEDGEGEGCDVPDVGCEEGTCPDEQTGVLARLSLTCFNQ